MLLNIILLLFFFLLIWSYSGYLTTLYIISRSKRNIRKEATKFPSLSLLIPCLNEQTLIKSKLKNVLQLKSPAKTYEILFIDGGSTDNTLKILSKQVAKHKNIKVLKTNLHGKIPQLNLALRQATGEIIIISDVDSYLNPDTLINLITEFHDPSVGASGSLVTPKNGLALEKHYWQTQNRVRLLESQAYTSSSINAPCYAFRKNIVSHFPTDVIADDVYTALKVNFSGYRTIYSKDSYTFELRNPETLGDWIIHKTRKGNAFIRELLRFLPSVGKGNVIWNLIFLTKCLQLLFIPSLLILIPLITFFNLNFLKLNQISSLTLLLLLSLFITHKITHQVDPLPLKKENWLQVTLAFFLTNLILVIQLWTYPFYKQTSSYEKLP